MGKTLSDYELTEIFRAVREAVRSLDWSRSFDRRELEQQKAQEEANVRRRSRLKKRKRRANLI